MRSFNWTRGLAAAAAIAFCLKVALAWFTIGTNDSLTWDHDLEQLRAGGFAQLYRQGVTYLAPSGEAYSTQDFIHPPAMITGLHIFGVLQDTSGIPLRFWLRLACALADVGTLAVISGMSGRWGTDKALMLLALSPISILISGFHANTDPIMIFFVVAAVCLMDRGRIGWAGVAFAIATSVKLVPIIFVPTLLFYLPDVHTRVKWAGIAAATWIAVCMPYLAQEPSLILKTILGYGSGTGLWGFLLFANLLKDTTLDPLRQAYSVAAKWIALGAVTLLPVVLKRIGARRSLFVQCGTVVFLFLFLSPSFGMQYLAWTVPWTAALGFSAALAYHAAVGGFLGLAYAAAAGGIAKNAYADVTHLDFTKRVLIRLVFFVAIGSILWLFARAAAAVPDPKRT